LVSGEIEYYLDLSDPWGKNRVQRGNQKLGKNKKKQQSVTTREEKSTAQRKNTYMSLVI